MADRLEEKLLCRRIERKPPKTTIEVHIMSTYVVTQDGSMFAVRLGDKDGPVIATFSNKLAAETFAEKQRVKDNDTAKALP